MSNPYSYKTLEEFVEAFEAVRKQVRAMKWLFGFMVVTFIAGFAALLYFAQDFSRNASVLDSRARSVEKQGIQMQSIIKEVGAVFQADLSRLGEKIEQVEQDVARLQIRLGGTGGDAASTQDDASSGEQKSNDPAGTPQASVKNEDALPPPLPIPRPRKMTQAPVASRPAESALASAGAVELKVGNQIAPGQFVLQPIPDELEIKMPKLKGMAFFRFADQIFVVDPKDNRIIELLK